MHIIEVTNKQTEEEFVLSSVIINKNTANYIRPIDKEINDIFNPSINKNFKYGTAKRWVLKNNQNQLIGRIAAFTNSKY